MQEFFDMEMPFTRHCGTRIFPMSWGGSHWHHDFDDDEAWKVWKSMESCGAAWIGPSDWTNLAKPGERDHAAAQGALLVCC